MSAACDRLPKRGTDSLSQLNVRRLGVVYTIAGNRRKGISRGAHRSDGSVGSVRSVGRAEGHSSLIVTTPYPDVPSSSWFPATAAAEMSRAGNGTSSARNLLVVRSKRRTVSPLTIRADQRGSPVATTREASAVTSDQEVSASGPSGRTKAPPAPQRRSWSGRRPRRPPRNGGVIVSFVFSVSR